MFPRELIPHVLDYSMTGSRAIVSPPPMDTDEDWVVLIPGTSYIEFSRIARGFGFEMTSNGEYRQSGSNDFKAFRKGELNLIVTIQKSFFHHYVFATRIGAALNLSNKDDRIILFHMIRDLPKGLC